MARIAMAWVLANDMVTGPIVGASKRGHVGDAIAALEVKLSVEEIAALDAPYRSRTDTGF